MAAFFNLLQCSIKRSLISLRFLGGSLGLAALYIVNMYPEISLYRGVPQPFLYFYVITNFFPLWILYLLFAAIPASTFFCEDYEGRFIRFAVGRSSKRIYGASTAAACFLSSGLVVVVGELIYIIALFAMGVEWSVSGKVNQLEGTAFGSLPIGTQNIIFPAACILAKAFSAGAFSVMALWVSTKITNIFATLAAPIILYYLIENVFILVKMPSSVSPQAVISMHISMGDNVALTILYPIALFLLLAVFFGFLFMNNVKRRIENG